MAVPLPTEIQTNLDLYNLNESLRAQRSEIDTAVSKIASGAYSAKNIFSELIDKLEETLRTIITLSEKVIVPEADFADFENNLTTLDEYASFDMLKYYNGIRKLLNFSNGFRVALLSLQDVPTQPVTPVLESSGDVLDTLETDEFIEQGFASPVFDKVPDFYYYTIHDGETLQKIANKVFDGDTNRWPEIAQINQLSDNDLIDSDLTGLVIKIPTEPGEGLFQNLNNLVYEPFFDGASEEQIEKFTYGSDLKINSKKFEISAIGDLRRIQGIACFIQNIQSRFDARKGTLNPSAQEWGLDPLDDFGNVPPVIALDRQLGDMEAQTLEDGRTVSASALRRSVEKIGDRINVDMEIFLIGGRNLIQNFNTSIG
jgi:hypothetical protein